MKADAKTEAEVRALMNRFQEGYQKRDEAGLLACLAPDADVILYGTGADEKRVGREAILDQARRDWAQTDAISMEFGQMSVSAAGPAAWVAIDGGFRIKAGGQAFTMPARITAVLEKRGDEWLMMQCHSSAPAAGQAEGQSIPG